MMRAVGDAAEKGDAFTVAFHTALAETLRAKGYDPVALHSGVFQEAIGGVIGSINAFKHLRAMRPGLRQPVFGNPAAHEVAGVFVAWVEFHLKVPSYSYNGMGTTTTITGDIPAPTGELYIEVFTPEGEPLVWTNRFFWEWSTIEPPWNAASGPANTPALEPGQTKVVGTYRVLPPEQIASTEVEAALRYLLPYVRQPQP
jgi:hypothetical protein